VKPSLSLSKSPGLSFHSRQTLSNGTEYQYQSTSYTSLAMVLPLVTSSPPPPQSPSVLQDRKPALVECTLQHLILMLNRLLYFICHGAALHHLFGSIVAVRPCTSGLVLKSRRTCSTAPDVDVKSTPLLCLPWRHFPPPLLCLHHRNTP